MKNKILLSWVIFFGFISFTFAEDKLVIISPHRKSIQDEFIPKFKEWYKNNFKNEVTVDWLDQGGTSDDIRFLKAKFNANPKSSGVDIFWGGGSATFMDLARDGLLSEYKLPSDLEKQVPKEVAGVALMDPKGKWYGVALSSFGLFFNKKLLVMDKLPEPKKWEDLADPKYFNQISLTDPRRSGSYSTMNELLILTFGWKKGWEVLTAIAANTKQFAHSSSDPIKAVVSGDVALSMAIDFYALAKIGDLGESNLGFVLPEGQTVLDPDPIALIKGAPNQKIAESFIQFVLSKDPQKLWVLNKGEKEGPLLSTLGRMAVNQETYKETEGKRTTPINPFSQKGYVKPDVEKSSKWKVPMDDLYGALLVDLHQELKAAWKNVVSNPNMKDEMLKRLAETPVTEEELLKYAEKWEDPKFRNEKINEWVLFSRAKFQKIAKK